MLLVALFTTPDLQPLLQTTHAPSVLLRQGWCTTIRTMLDFGTNTSPVEVLAHLAQQMLVHCAITPAGQRC